VKTIHQLPLRTHRVERLHNSGRSSLSGAIDVPTARRARRVPGAVTMPDPQSATLILRLRRAGDGQTSNQNFRRAH
jgi:hypothetical protein